jgi:glycosyltransferase involved in cell wall biosynthesis
MIYAPFFCSIDDDDADGNAPSSFGSRRNFAFVGGFRHMPNVDSVRLLRRVLWPMIRQRLPGAILQVCGAHPTPEISSFHDESVGFLVRGMVDDLDSVLRNSRVLLAPLRYGAGIKGKVVDAWMSGLPVVTTRVGAEGMTTTTTDGCDDYGGMRTTIECRGWGGLIEDDALDFAESAIELHEREEVWNRCRDDGVELLRRLFDGGVNLPVVEEGIRDGIANLEKRRKMDVFGSILWRDGSRSTEYFSRWIELKESLVDGATAKRR